MQTGRRTDRHADTPTHRYTDAQMHKYTDTQRTERQTDRQTGTDRQKLVWFCCVVPCCIRSVAHIVAVYLFLRFRSLYAVFFASILYPFVMLYHSFIYALCMLGLPLCPCAYRGGIQTKVPWVILILTLTSALILEQGQVRLPGSVLHTT